MIACFSYDDTIDGNAKGKLIMDNGYFVTDDTILRIEELRDETSNSDIAFGLDVSLKIIKASLRVGV